jgi:hypothetical protein
VHDALKPRINRRAETLTLRSAASSTASAFTLSDRSAGAACRSPARLHSVPVMLQTKSIRSIYSTNLSICSTNLYQVMLYNDLYEPAV